MQSNHFHMSFLQRFFMLFGILSFIFLILLIAGGAYVWVKDPLGLKPLFLPSQTESANTSTSVSNPKTSDSGVKALLTPEQQKLLDAAGVDVNKLPKEITPELKACAEAKLGKERLAALKAGAQPTLSDLLVAKGCIK